VINSRRWSIELEEAKSSNPDALGRYIYLASLLWVSEIAPEALLVVSKVYFKVQGSRFVILAASI
jgi:hypothetical protein